MLTASTSCVDFFFCKLLNSVWNVSDLVPTRERECLVGQGKGHETQRMHPLLLKTDLNAADARGMQP